MSYLDRLKEKAAAQKAEKKEPAKTDNIMDGAEENKKVASILSRLKNKTEEVKESLQEKANAVVKEVIEKNQPVDSPAKEESETNTKKKTEIEEVATIDEAREEAVEETKEEAVKEAKNIETEKTPSEEKSAPPKKRGRKKKTEVKKDSEEESVEINTDEYEQNYDLLGKKCSYDEMAQIVLDFFEEDDWKEKEEDLNKRLRDIRIEADMNPGTLKYALAALNNLYDEVAVFYDSQRKILACLADKDFGIAVAHKKMHSFGSNSEERERNGIKSLTQVRIDGSNPVNYFAIVAGAKVRNIFLSNFIERIKNKTQSCITMSGAIKMEQNLITMSA